MNIQQKTKNKKQMTDQYLDGKHHNGGRSRHIDVQLKVVDHSGVTAL